jgi:hypothetical protein
MARCKVCLWDMKSNTECRYKCDPALKSPKYRAARAAKVAHVPTKIGITAEEKQHMTKYIGRHNLYKPTRKERRDAARNT